jgi:hypothetical protein
MKGSVPAYWVFIAAFALPCTILSAQSTEFVEMHAARLTQLIAQLDTARPELQLIAHNWERGDRLTAAQALIEFCDRGSSPAPFLESLNFPANAADQANRALRDEFFILGDWYLLSTDPSQLDWGLRGPSGDKEVAWMLNRHSFLPILAEWHRQTGDPRYADKANALLQDWLAQHPYPNRLSFSPAWRALEVARRMLDSWIHIFFYYDCLSPETRLLLLASIPEHADALLEHTSFWGGNHLMTEKLALLQLSIAFPLFKESGRWQENALATLKDLFLKQSYPDGSYSELSNHYQRVVLVNALTFKRLINALPETAIPVDLHERLEQMWDFFAGVTRPDGTGPLNNAGDQERNADFLNAAWELYARPDWHYIASGATVGTPPADPPSRIYPWAGQAILRTGFTAQDNWVYFDAGPYGTAHQHLDRMHISAYLNGRSLLVDGGRYTYQPGPWKDYFAGPHSHNILLVDGQPAVQAPRRVTAPLPLNFVSEKHYTSVESVAHFALPGFLNIFPKIIPWTRSLLLDHRGFLIVIDQLQFYSDHTIEALWNCDPRITDTEARQLLTLASEANASVTLVRGQEDPVAGFHSPDYGLKVPAAQIQYRTQTHSPTTFVWLIQNPEVSNYSVHMRDGTGPQSQFVISCDNEHVATLTLSKSSQGNSFQYATH